MIDKDVLMDMVVVMMRIRRFEEKLLRLTAEAKISGFVHLYIGEEAVATGVCSLLRADDVITSTHRGHGHLIAKGGQTKLMMAELFAKSTGYCKGKGGSMHIADLDIGILGANGIVGGGPPLAAGAALAQQYQGTDNVTICFYGDGSSNQGTVHEAMNLASIWSLPVVFVGENNGVAEFTHQSDHQNIQSLAERATAYGIPGVSVDGNDILAVREAASEAISHARKGNGPTILECRTFRIGGHFVGDPEPYRSADDVKAWQAVDKDPILRFQKYLLDNQVCTQHDLDACRTRIDEELAAAVRFAEESPEPDVSELLTDVYAN
ncbi:MAG: thiamine pyrophosphate-dependent dehydrogenase E1 component subunit alpha [bacterium]